ncbi:MULTISPECIES: DUF6480 family protein [Streptomyces]|uniref:SCO1431 family membrane protein n=1 Tax=Streptomyces spongiicola TaxID=1690221 RepID=A0A2S1Z7J7_9ACTN|nr:MULTISPECIES: DUF6480 family protein [Streptomyces]AWK12337.1 hypothetical protein DDQ41_29305 [Streptomyces spongiicola]RNL73649.1 hypothetical protein EBF04_27630 [Streptomyces sp. I6]GBQ02412.1 hypothetical protein SSP531S_38710 [Streptomyces spongiicola]
MTDRRTPPQETPPVEASIAEAHQERPDGGIWEHPVVILSLIVACSVFFAALFIGRALSL